jgi:pyrroloquinoline quinone biosynthesis protein B
MGRLAVRVLGSAAGGGFPQWNCRCAVCRLGWAGDTRVRPRTQASLAASLDGEHWVLINASPDLPAQIRCATALHPRAQARGSPIKAVVLTGAEIDQIAGLLSLREGEPFTIHATAAILAAIADNPMFGVLAPETVRRQATAPAAPLLLPGGLEAQLFMVPGKVPLYLESEDLETASESAANVGVELRGGSARLVYIPGAAGVTASMRERIARADVVFFDGTLFRDDEMIASGTGSKTGLRMGHMPVEGPNGSLAALDGIAARRIYTHINNTNPMLIEGSPERVMVERRGWEVAEDGMEISL